MTVFIIDVDRSQVVIIAQLLQERTALNGLQTVSFIIRQIDPVAVFIKYIVVSVGFFIQESCILFNDE